jgi:hypothetical protein
LIGILNLSEATLNPGALGLFETTIEGFTFLILPAFTADNIAFMLLPLPEIRIPRFTTGNLLYG